MKFLAILVALVMAVPCAFALDDITPPKGGSFYDGPTLQPRVDSAADTTDTTAYTPRFIGDWLMGKTGTSNAVWIARDLTTNGWSLIDGNGGPFSANDIADNAVTESKLKAVDTASDEDFLTYEATTGDFEWHSVADKAGAIAAAITEGQLANSVVVSADVKDGELVNADLSATAGIAHTKLAAVLPGYLLVGSAASQAVAVAVSGDITMGNDGAVGIGSGVIVNADISGSAAIVATKISGTAVTYSTAAQADTNAVTVSTGYTPAFVAQVLVGSDGEGTNAVWVAKGVTTNDWVKIKP